ncbi:MAG: hypothetical protein A3G34_01325 [Candidatus Lindowbacteria bacterium RIFCSPLOWO2_12_FULL_62_27]|nr:MAG: hypothetical protein A3G34_01325 [Candidatus Lindowbacteria bacterium RIFCSPLOWO2_12_FULL_62_27]OGH63710.1 MAG: hypothetical protein A3I06_07785 [Candidatus Lindowbacteria bacterium RIFCSPLOWO2_02_FULL_62_12]
MLRPAALVLMLLANPASDRQADLKSAHDEVMRQIRAREAEYEREQETLKKTKREAVDLGRKERGILKKLEAAEKAWSRTRAELAVLQRQMEALQKDILLTQAQWQTEHSSLEHREWLLARRLKNLYLYSARSGRTADLIAYGDLSVSFGLREGLRRAAESDHRLIGRIRRKKLEIEKIQDLLAAKESRLRDAQKKKASLERRQDQERARRQELLRDVRSRRSALDEVARQIEMESANLKVLLVSLQERSLKLKEQMAWYRKEFEDKKGILIWPVEPAAIRGVRSFGKNFDESIGAWRMNKGIDILTETNQSVRAVSKGEVVFADFMGRMGNLVILSHGGDYFTLYAHLSEIGVTLSSVLEQGAPLGRAGNTGLLEETAVLHFEIRRGSQAIDPEKWMGRRP